MTKVENKKDNVNTSGAIAYLRVSKESYSPGKFSIEKQKQRTVEFLDRNYGVGNDRDIEFKTGD